MVIVTIGVIRYRAPHYGGHSINEWLYSTNVQARTTAFRMMGKNSFVFLAQKLERSVTTSGGSLANCEKACLVIETAFTGSEIKNTEIQTGLMRMLTSGNATEEFYAYEAIHQLGLQVPESAIKVAARTCPSIKTSEEESGSQPKLLRLRSMTTESLDCSYIARLCDDPDPKVQMAAIGFLARLQRKGTNGNNLCADEIPPAMAILMTNTTAPSVVRMALAYMSTTPKLMRNNLGAVCHFLDETRDSNLQMDCLSLIALLGQYGPLSSSARQSIATFILQDGLTTEVRAQASTLLDNSQG